MTKSPELKKAGFNLKTRKKSIVRSLYENIISNSLVYARKGSLSKLSVKAEK